LYVKITNEDNAHHILQYEGYRSSWTYSKRPVNQAYYVEKLKQLCETVCRKMP
jgi:hypothetical protein